MNDGNYFYRQDLKLCDGLSVFYNYHIIKINKIEFSFTIVFVTIYYEWFKLNVRYKLI